ncbi:MAG: GNAT family N-acetyltransferase [Solirubrobacterales bacterium]|nr:GNAT family N-acetyltransferase [Solirubrobacterales bacterium]
MPAIPELNAPLTDGRVSLRLSAERDIPEILIAYQDDPELHLRMGIEKPPSGAQLGRRAEEASGGRAAGTHVTFTIVEPASDVCRGQIDVHNTDWEHQRAELGIWLAPQVRGRGWAPAALTLACRWLFEACGFERLEVLTEPDNEPMIRTARRAGFVEEGILRGYLRERGKRVDTTIMSLLPGDIRS